MNSNKESKYRAYLKQLIEFQKPEREFNLKEFEDWRKRVSSELSDTFKARFNRLSFYKTDEEFENEIPF